jgi:hypothetical protein
MKFDIDELGLKNISFSDLLGAYNEEEIDEIKEQILREENYQDELLYFVKDDDSNEIECSIIEGNFESIDQLNLMKLFKDDPLVMIVKDVLIGEKSDGKEIYYVSFEAHNTDKEPPTLKGGEYDKKTFMSKEELAEFQELSENDDVSFDEAKYQEFHFIKTSLYDPKEWIQKWLSQDYGHNNSD